MHKGFEAWVEGLVARRAWWEADRVVLAVSGGCDSMVLFRGMLEVGRRLDRPPEWVVAHLNHQLRGAESDADEALVQETAEAAGVRCVTRRHAVGAHRKAGESLEAVARQWRHRFLAEVAREVGSRRVATAHHEGDQVETFLMRLLRGAGPVGLGAMSEEDPSPADPGVGLIRPLLRVARLEIREWAAAGGVRWREDASNTESDPMRNRIRHELVPLLEARFQPALGRVLGRVQTVLRDQAAWGESMARAWLEGTDDRDYAVLPLAMQREVIRVQLIRMGYRPGFELIEELRESPGEVVAQDSVRGVVRGGDGRVREVALGGSDPGFRGEELWVVLGGNEARGEVRFGGVTVRWTTHEGGGGWGGLERESGREVLDRDAVGERMVLRHWRPGDRYRPIGLRGSVKLQDAFTEAGVPVVERRRRVLAATEDGEIFWVQGLRIGEWGRVREGTRRRWLWNWSPVEP